jgi:Zn-dependent protease with chaperone function
MSYGPLALIVAFAAYALVNMAAAAVALVIWRAARRDADGVSAAARARGLFMVRLLPVTASLVLVAGVVSPAFHLFEPRGQDEPVGASLAALAASGLLLFAVARARAWRASRATRRLVRAWVGEARPLSLDGARLNACAVDTDFPVVALVGLLRPRLLVARRVLEACAPKEIGAIVAHERGHLAACDNLKRLAIRCCPDVLALMPVGAAMERAWVRAAEDAADDHAARAAGARAEDLAGALVKVARLASGDARLSLPASTFYDGGGVERRVRRVLSDERPTSVVAGWLVATHAVGVLAALTVAAGALEPRFLEAVQQAVEVLVAVLP